MHVYSLATDQGVHAYFKVTDKTYGALFPSWGALGLAFGALCAIGGLKMVYDVPFEMAAGAELVKPETLVALVAFHLNVDTRTKRSVTAGKGSADTSSAHSAKLIFLTDRDLQERVTALHDQLDIALERGSWQTASQLAIRIRHLRREFLAK